MLTRYIPLSFFFQNFVSVQIHLIPNFLSNFILQLLEYVVKHVLINFEGFESCNQAIIFYFFIIFYFLFLGWGCGDYLLAVEARSCFCWV